MRATATTLTRAPKAILALMVHELIFTVQVSNLHLQFSGKIFFIKDNYERMETDFLDEIDAQVRRYTRATTQKIENLTNRDQNVKGNLNYLLTALANNTPKAEFTEIIASAITLTEQGFLSEKSLQSRRKSAKRDDNRNSIRH